MTPQVQELFIPGVYEITPPRFQDERGFFSETFSAERLAPFGIDTVWAQDNHSLSRNAGVLRGMHYQLPPFAQDKLVRVPKGRVFDVVADIRMGSPTFGKWVGVELSAKKWNQLFVPKGFAHGFLTLEPGTEFVYKVSKPYAPDLDRSIRFDDPTFDIKWPISGEDAVLSSKDQMAPFLEDADLPETWDD